MGRDLAYLPAVHDGKTLGAIAPPLLVLADGSVVPLPGTGAPASLLARSTEPPPGADAPGGKAAAWLRPAAHYTLSLWKDGAWTPVGDATAGVEQVQPLP